MEILVINYTDWIGYHIVDSLLNEGHTVYGLEKETGNPHLKDFFMRNSQFKEADQILATERNFSRMICIGNQEGLEEIDAAYYFLINAVQQPESLQTLTIQAPFLFGEFMPMDENAFYEGKKRVKFDSEVFIEKGIYIADFLIYFNEWVQNPPDLQEITVKSGKHCKNETLILEKTFLIHENIPISLQTEDVLAHFKKNRTIYPKEIEK